METWDATYVGQSEAPMGIRGWQAAFLAVGIPGILMAFWVWTLKEPQRGQSEGLIAEVHPAPFKVLGTELAAMLPIINLIGLRRLGVGFVVFQDFPETKNLTLAFGPLDFDGMNIFKIVFLTHGFC